jgi:hypothetical protein
VSTPRRNWTAGFYWTGVALTLACFAFVLAGNTELMWRFEHRGSPLSWAVAGAGVVAFLAAELCDSAFSLGDETEGASSQLSPELEVAES